MPSRKKTENIGAKQIAKERIEILFAEAKKAFPTHPERAHSYIHLARRIGMRLKVPIPPNLKQKTCKKCRHYLVPGKNSKTRLKSGIRLVTCQDCGTVMRYPYNKIKT